MRKEIENRLIKLSVDVIRFVSSLPNSMLNNTLSDQLIRSTTSAALNYGEAQAAESKNDFIHKTSVVLKELRESSIALKIFMAANSVKNSNNLPELIDECNQLTAIFQKTVTTARSKN